MNEGIKWTIREPETAEEEAERIRLNELHMANERPLPLRCYCGRFISSKALEHSRTYFGEYLVSWKCGCCPEGMPWDEPPLHWFE